MSLVDHDVDEGVGTIRLDDPERRNALTKELSDELALAVESVIAQQASRAARRACADAVVFNDGVSPAQLAAAVQSLWRHWCIVRA